MMNRISLTIIRFSLMVPGALPAEVLLEIANEGISAPELCVTAVPVDWDGQFYHYDFDELRTNLIRSGVDSVIVEIGRGQYLGQSGHIDRKEVASNISANLLRLLEGTAIKYILLFMSPPVGMKDIPVAAPYYEGLPNRISDEQLGNYADYVEIMVDLITADLGFAPSGVIIEAFESRALRVVEIPPTTPSGVVLDDDSVAKIRNQLRWKFESRGLSACWVSSISYSPQDRIDERNRFRRLWLENPRSNSDLVDEVQSSATTSLSLDQGLSYERSYVNALKNYYGVLLQNLEPSDTYYFWRYFQTRCFRQDSMSFGRGPTVTEVGLLVTELFLRATNNSRFHAVYAVDVDGKRGGVKMNAIAISSASKLQVVSVDGSPAGGELMFQFEGSACILVHDEVKRIGEGGLYLNIYSQH